MMMSGSALAQMEMIDEERSSAGEEPQQDPNAPKNAAGGNAANKRMSQVKRPQLWKTSASQVVGAGALRGNFSDKSSAEGDQAGKPNQRTKSLPRRSKSF